VKSLPPFLLPLLLLWPLALCAQEAPAPTYDLRQIMKRTPPAGTRVRERQRESETQTVEVLEKGEVRQTDKEAKGYDEERVTEILSVDAKGEAKTLRHTYVRYKDFKTRKDLEVKGLVVDVTLGKEPKLRVPEGKPLPKILRRRLLAEHTGEETQGLFAAKAVADGGTWTIEPKAFAKEMGLPPQDLDLKASSGSGKLERVEQRGATPWVHFSLRLKLVFKVFQELKTKEPFVIEMTLAGSMPVDPKQPGGTLKRSFKSRGLLIPEEAPPNVLVRLRQEGSGEATSEVERAK
jgi:hypothetical protein